MRQERTLLPCPSLARAQRRYDRERRIGGSGLQVTREARGALLRHQLRQSVVRGERGGERRERSVRMAARAHDRAPPLTDAGHDAARAQAGHNSGLRQRRLAGAAGAENQEKGPAGVGVFHQPLDRRLGRRAPPEKDRRVLEAIGLQSAEWAAPEPYGGRRCLRIAGLTDAALDQAAQIGFELELECVELGKFTEGRPELAAPDEISAPERFQALQLPPKLFEVGGGLVFRLRGGLLAVGKQVRQSVLLARSQRVLELPLGAGDRSAPVDAAILSHLGALGQRRSQPRPQDQHDDVAFARRHDRVLEVSARQHRLGLPEDRRDVEEPRVVLGHFLDHERGAPPLRIHVGRRGNEDPKTLRHRVFCPWPKNLEDGPLGRDYTGHLAGFQPLPGEFVACRRAGRRRRRRAQKRSRTCREVVLRSDTRGHSGVRG